MRIELPTSLRIALIGQNLPIMSRSSDQGHIWPIARELAHLGHEVTLISTKSNLGQFQIERDGIHAYYVKDGNQPLARMAFVDACYKLFFQLHQTKPFHLVHSLDSSAYKIARNKKKLKTCVAYDVESTQMSQLFSILGMQRESVGSLLTTAFAITYKFLSTYFGQDRNLLNTADGIFVKHPLQRILLERYYLFPDFHIYTVPYGTLLGDLSLKEKSPELRKKLGLPDTTHVILTLSDMTQLQEMTNLLRAFEKVVLKKPNTNLILVGNGPYFKQIEYEIYNLALGNRVIMVGALKEEEILDHLLLSDVYINMSSRMTGFEPTLLEAMAQKKVIIGSELSPISNVVEDGVDGFLLRPADIDSLSRLLIEIFSGTLPAHLIGEKAREKVIGLFDTHKMVNTLLDAYCKILLNSEGFKSRKIKNDLALSQA